MLSLIFTGKSKDLPLSLTMKNNKFVDVGGLLMWEFADLLNQGS
jgi:hypothetical protein